MFGKLKQMFSSGEARVSVKQRFELLGKSGQGSMSKVFHALDKKLNRKICLKLLDKEKTAQFDARFAGLKRPSEGEICLGLKHPNIVETYEHGLTTEGEQYLVMEWVEGQGLHALIEASDPQLTGKRIKHLRQMAEALNYLHQQRLLHRDICPRNVLINPAGTVKLIDFGLSLPYTPEFCKPGNRTGTVCYLAPEVIKRTSTDHRLDLFALGVTAYELFTGQLPFGRAESMQTLLSHLNNQPHDPREYLPDLDEATVKFLLKAIEREPARRFQSAAAFREELRNLPQTH